MNDVRVVIGQPLYNHITPRAHGELIEFIGSNISNGLYGYRYVVDAYIDDARNQLVEEIMQCFPQATHVLLIDQDVTLPKTALQQLLAADKEIVSGLYFDKSKEHIPVAFESLSPPVRLSRIKEGVHQVAGVGLGCILIRMMTLRHISHQYKDKKWFRSNDEGGEDFNFCGRCKHLSIPIFLDSQVVCGHMADKEITARDWTGFNQPPKE